MATQLYADVSFSSPSSLCSAKRLYTALLNSDPDSACSDVLADSEEFLHACFSHTEGLSTDLPAAAQYLPQWSLQHTRKVASDYAAYRQQRKKGGRRHYFPTRSHALAYLQDIAPTKLVDGAWLYPVLNHWQDNRFLPLITTYLEELGEGNESQNHVTLFKKLLVTYGCEQGPELTDNLYFQGAIQLALGLNKDKFLPELIGYNLGYEQLPLHLLITAYELEELGIDPYYFTLHVSSDNASSGHAYKAIKTILDIIPSNAEGQTFYQRMKRGFLLNELGPGATDIMHAFDLESRLHAMLAGKSVFAQSLHSDRCRIGGDPVNAWLSHPERIPEFLSCMENTGWISRHADPVKSRFWQVIDGEKAKMAGVFSPVEAQLIYDWIAGEWLDTHSNTMPGPECNRAKFSYKRQSELSLRSERLSSPMPDVTMRELQQELRGMSYPAKMKRLTQFLSPAQHTTPAGLYATSIYTRLIYSH